jgi:hypothetical protein
MENDSPGDFYISAVIRRMMHFWWLIPVLMIAGGILGYLFSRLQKPVYESTAVITTVIDYAYAGRITDFEEDHVINAIGDVIVSDDVMNAVWRDAEESGLLAESSLLRKNLTLSRQGYRWELSSRSNDASTARSLNQLWLDYAVNALERIRQDSIYAMAEFTAQEEVITCFSQSVVMDPSSPFCGVDEMKVLQENLASLPDSEQKDSLSSRLLFSRITYQVTREPDLPAAPVHNRGNVAGFTGAIAGLITSIFILVFGFPRTKLTSQ